jgi:septum formation protein
VEERTEGEAHELALHNARLKARTTAERHPAGTLVLGVDTVVAVDDDVLGKPSGPAEARAMLERLEGREHAVVSGLHLTGVGEGTAATRVRFRALDGAALDAYVARGEWRGRAGAYAIQEAGALLVRELHGDYLNVVGLPVALLADLLGDLLG